MGIPRERHSTFHEHWHLVENLTPRLRHEITIRRQVNWGMTFYVLSEPDNNKHYRLAKGAYAFVALLDGIKTVQEVWDICQNAKEEEALTQNEVIALLGRLHTSNLLILDISVDIDQILRRKQKERLKKLGNLFSAVLFLRIPIGSPDSFFTKYQRIGNFIFNPIGYAIWFFFLFMALRALISHWGIFVAEAKHMLNPSNLIWIYAVTIIAKIVHESGHAFACKFFAARDGLHGDVHNMGIMLLLFAPVPYIDVSSSVQIRSRWARAFVGLGGVYCELFLAFIATLLWVNTADDTALHLLARNCIIITSVTTMLFNLNPLLRFDGYFVLSDLLGMPNLYQRSQTYMVYLFKRYILKVDKASTVVHMRNEKRFYPVYAIVAFIYRIFITLGIFLILEENFATLGTILALGLLFIWFILPAIKGLLYLVKGAELAGMRSRAWVRFTLFLSVISFSLLAVPVEDAIVVEGIVESRQQYFIFSEAEGNLSEVMDTDAYVYKGKTQIVNIDNPGIMAELKRMSLSVDIAKANYDHAKDQGDTNVAGMYYFEYRASLQQRNLLQEQVRRQRIFAPVDGVWVAPDLAKRHGKWLAKGDALGSIYSPDALRLRVAVGQFDAARLFVEPFSRTEFSISSRMDIRNSQGALFEAVAEGVPVPAGRRELLHPSLSMQAGGKTATIQSSDGEILTVNYFFELRLLPEQDALAYLKPGQKILVRVVFGEQSLGVQWLRRLQQFFKGR